MTFSVRFGGTWRVVPPGNAYGRHSGEWKRGDLYVRSAGVWRLAVVGSFVFNATISANTSNYNLRSAALAAGWDGNAPLIATVTINSGVTVFSNSTGSYAFQTGSPFPAGSVLTLINNGVILGRGGNGGTGGGNNGSSVTAGGVGTAGGPGLLAQYALSITNNGLIAAGGGGAGGGASGLMYNSSFDEFFFCHGGGGGGGRGPSSGGPLGPGTLSDRTTIFPTAGGGGTVSSAGSGGNRQQVAFPGFSSGGEGGFGGTGGAAGSSGGNGGATIGAFNAIVSVWDWGTAGTGGPSSNAVVGNSLITWLNTGTRLGGIVA